MEDPVSEILFAAGREVGTVMRDIQDRARGALFGPVGDAIRAAYRLGYEQGAADERERSSP